MNVLVIPEDSRRDKYLLKPLVTALMAEVGRPHAKVRVCEKPVLGGVATALQWDRIHDILDLWGGQTDLFLLIVDRDGEANKGRREALTSLEKQSTFVLTGDKALLGEHAIEEVEVWVLACHDLPPKWSIRDIRAHPHPKEEYFVRFLVEHRRMTDDAASWALIGQEAARGFRRAYDRCPEDLQRLTERVRELIRK